MVFFTINKLCCFKKKLAPKIRRRASWSHRQENAGEKRKLAAIPVAAKRKKRFGEAYIENFNQKMTELLEKAEMEATSNMSVYSGPFERALIARIIKYRENYFAWVENFTLPTTNNLSERALRGVDLFSHKKLDSTCK